MRRSSAARDMTEQAVALHRGRLICALLRKERLLAQNTRLVLQLADRLLESYAFRNYGRI
jgi:hypothetical protein